MITPKMGNFPTRYRLPTGYSTEIGKIITRFSYVQFQIKVCTYTVLEIGKKEGRLTVREPDVAEAMTVIEQIMEIKGLKPFPNMATLKTRLQEVESYRNKLAHGIWLYHGDERTPVIQETKGYYVPKQGAPKVSARLFPKAAKVPLPVLRTIRGNLDTCAKHLHSLQAGLERQLPPSSRQKRTEQLELGLNQPSRGPKNSKGNPPQH